MTRACERCGSEIDAASLKKTPSKRFCSMSCKRKAAYRRAVSSHGPAYGPGRKCLECGREVLKNHHRCCSRECGVSRSQRLASERAAARRAVCEHCGNLTPARKHHSRPQRFCSRACFLASVRTPGFERRHSRTRWTRDAEHRRRAKRFGGDVAERFAPVEIFDRDKWVCQLCGEPVSAELSFPHPLSPSLDHVVPLSLGGPHSKANARLAHLACNCASYAKSGVSCA